MENSSNLEPVVTTTTELVLITAEPAEPEFNYAGLDEATASQLRASVSSIRARHRKIFQDIVAIGTDLIEAKRLLGHGNFGKWIASEFQWSERTARAYMSIAEYVETLSAEESAIIAGLPLTTLIKLSAPSTPKSVYDEIILKAEAGERLKGSDIEEMIRRTKTPEPKCRVCTDSTVTQPAAETFSADPPHNSGEIEPSKIHIVSAEVPSGGALTNCTTMISDEQPDIPNSLRRPLTNVRVAEPNISINGVREFIKRFSLALGDDALLRELAEMVESTEGLNALRSVMGEWSRSRVSSVETLDDQHLDNRIAA
jgi:hypothetical protein